MHIPQTYKNQIDRCGCSILYPAWLSRYCKRVCFIIPIPSAIGALFARFKLTNVKVLIVMLSPYMFPNVIPFGGIMCTKIAIPHRIGRVVICYILCKICLIITHFTTVTFIILGHKNCRYTSLCIVPGVSNIHTIAPVFCIQSFVTGFINTSPL